MVTPDVVREFLDAPTRDLLLEAHRHESMMLTDSVHELGRLGAA